MSAVAILFTDYPAAGGQRLGTLTLIDGTERTRLDGNESTTLVVGRARWQELGGDLRMVVRLVWPEGTIVERRISQVETTDTAGTTQLTLLPMFADLGTGGPITRVVAGSVATRVAGQLPLSVALSTYVTPHPAAQRLGLVVGTLERDPVLSFDLDAPTPAALMLELFDRAKLEIELVRTSDTVTTLNGRIRRGSTAAALRIREARNQQRLAIGVDEQQFATVVVPLGDADPATGDRATIATARWVVTGIASGWVQLRNPDDTTRSPIIVDTQWQGAWLVDRFGFAQAILNARTSDGAVQVSSTAGLTTGARVWVASNAAGDPLVEIYDASATGARRRVVPLPLSGFRGEANELPNGRFRDGLTGWSVVNPTTPSTVVEVARADFGSTITAQANGARAAGTGTGTPFAVKGLGANRIVRQGAQLRVGGATLPITSDVIASSTGALTIPVGGGGLPGDYPDDTPFSLIRREIRTLTLDGDQSPLVQRLRFRDSNTDQLPQGTAVTGSVASAVGSYTGPFTGVSYVDAASYVQAGRLILDASVTWPTQALDVFTLAITSVDPTNGFIFHAGAGGTLQVGTRVRYQAQNSQLTVVRVTVVDTGRLTVVPESDAIVQPWAGAGVGQCSNVLVADGSTWTVTLVRETRLLRLNGAQSAGTTSVPFKAQSLLATRNFTTSDTVELVRVLTATLDVSSLVLNGSGQLEATFAAGTSTADEIAPADYAAPYSALFSVPTTNPAIPQETWRLVAISGSVATLELVSTNSAATRLPGVWSATWPVFDTYAVTGAASWGNDGRVTVPIATVPTGRSYVRGALVWATWHTRAANGVFSQLRLVSAVSAGATSITLAGQDGFTSTGDATAAAPLGVYRVPASGSTLPVPGNTLYAASTVQADGSGNANVVLTAANGNAIANNEAVVIETPALLRPSDETTGAAVRLFNATLGFPPGTSAPALASPLIPIAVPTGQTRTVTAFVTFTLSQGTYPTNNQPVIALVNGAGTVIGSARVFAGSVTAAQTPTIVRVITSVSLTSSTAVGIRVYGGTSDLSLWTVVLDAMLAVTDRDDAPFVLGSLANGLAIRGAEELAARRDPAVSVQLALATLHRWSDAPAGAPVVIGQTVELPALGLTRRVLTIDRSVIDPSRVTVEVGVLTEELTTQVGGLLAGASL